MLPLLLLLGEVELGEVEVCEDPLVLLGEVELCEPELMVPLLLLLCGVVELLPALP